MSQRGMVQKIPRVRTQIIPPRGAVPAGFTHDGKHQLWKQTRAMNRPVPYIVAERSDKCGAKHTWDNEESDTPECTVCGTFGERQYTKGTQNQKVIPRNKPNVVQEERVFYLEDCGNCNVVLVDYAPPSEAELAAAERKKRIKAMDGVLAQVLVDGGLDANEVMERLTQQPATAAEEVADQVEEVSEPEPTIYPIADEKGPWWTLSNGERVRGEETARAREIELQAQMTEAREEARTAAEASY